MNDFTFYNPTKLLFGAGKLAELHNEKLPGKKALLLISNGKSTKTNGSLSKTEEELKLSGVEYVIFDKIIENPLNTTVMEAPGRTATRREWQNPLPKPRGRADTHTGCGGKVDWGNYERKCDFVL